MKCSKCGGEWSPPEGIDGSICPFCYSNALFNSGQCDDLIAREILMHIKDEYGLVVFAEKKRMSGLLADYFSKNIKTKKILTLAVRDNIPRKLLELKNLSRDEKELKLQQIIFCFTDENSLVKKMAEDTIGLFVDVLGVWDELDPVNESGDDSNVAQENEEPDGSLKITYEDFMVETQSLEEYLKTENVSAVALSGHDLSKEHATAKKTRTMIKECASGFLKVAAGSEHSAAIDQDGALWTWGRNFFGQMGDGTTIDSAVPFCVLKSGITEITSIADFTYALETDGSLWGWGYNQEGEIGDGTLESRLSPVCMMQKDVSQAAAGNAHGLAIKNDGSLWSWGSNQYGQLGDKTKISRKSPKCINTSGVRKIAAGFGHSIAIKSDGSLWSWGDNQFGQLGNGSEIDTNHPACIISDRVVAIASGFHHALAIKSDGSLWSWGFNQYGQLGNGSEINEKKPSLHYDEWCR